MKCYLSLLLWLTAGPVQAQLQIGWKRDAIQQHWQQTTKTNNQKVSQKKEGAEWVAIVGQPSRQAITYRYQFDEYGYSISQQLQSPCSTCIQEKLGQFLALTDYQWRKLNENQFVSRFEDKLMIELAPDGSMGYLKLLRMEWTEALYELIRKN